MKHVLILSAVAAMLVVPCAAVGQDGASGDNFPAWLKDKLSTLSDVKQPVEQRLSARDAIISECGPAAPVSNAVRYDRCDAAARQLRPLLASGDMTTVVNCGMIMARLANLKMVKLLTDSVSSPLPVVRYWAARGLAELQVDMFRIGDRQFFFDPVEALGAQGVREDNPLVAREIYRALQLADASRMVGELQRSAIRKQFLAVFEARARRLDKGLLDGASAELVGLEVAAGWVGAYGPGRNRDIIGPLVFWQSQLLQWAVQTYAESEGLGESARNDLGALVLKASELLSQQAGDKAFFADVQKFLVNQSNLVDLRIRINSFVGLTGLNRWTTQSLGQADAPRPLSPPTTQPAGVSSVQQPVG